MKHKILCAAILVFGLAVIHSKIIDFTFIKDVLSIVKVLCTFDPNEDGLDSYLETQEYGYPAEKHTVITEDGYILTLLRIPYGKSDTVLDNKRPIVLLIPGILCSAACFTDNIATSNHSLAYSLANLGYDVWIINPRGSTFSRKHTTYNALTDELYWKFGWHEIGTIDIPTTIDYILETTNEKQLSVFGHSMGTTSSFVMLSEKPAYNEKVKVFLGLAPVAFVEHVDLVFKILAANYDLISALADLLQIYYILPHTKALSEPIMALCNYESSIIELAICELLIDIVAGHPERNIDPRKLYHIISHFPAGASLQEVKHHGQLVISGGFRKYDYGKYKNQQIYGQITPPAYNLENVKIPVYLVYGNGDNIADLLDVHKLHGHLPNSQLIRVDDMEWSHLDFLFAKNAYELVYKNMFEILNLYNQ